MSGRLRDITRRLEGRTVSIALRDGSRIDGCNLVSSGRHRAHTLWVFAAGLDRFVPFTDVIDVWEV